MLKTTLLKIGLTEKETEVYLLILKHGEITASKISKIGNESRTHTYDVLSKLLKKSLINYVIKNNVKYFNAVGPEKLLDYLDEKEIKIQEEKREISEMLPEIRKLQEFKREDFKVEIYEGVEGVKTMMNNILREGKNFVTWGASDRVKEYLPDFYIRKYLNERKKRKIKGKQLFTNVYGVLKSPFSENRKLPKEFASPTTTVIYGDKVSIWLWLEIPRVILVENKDLAKSYRKHFELMWETAKKS